MSEPYETARRVLEAVMSHITMDSHDPRPVLAAIGDLLSQYAAKAVADERQELIRLISHDDNIHRVEHALRVIEYRNDKFPY